MVAVGYAHGLSDTRFLRKLEEQFRARANLFTPITPADRVAAFRSQGFRPTGIFLPDDDAARARVLAVLHTVGQIENPDERLVKYFELQEKTEQLELRGFAGHWTAQQAVTRSPAPFRLVAWGRRSGKSLMAAHEGVSVARSRPRSWIWVCAPTMLLVSRCFDLIEQILQDLDETILVKRNTVQHKLLVLENGSRIEGVSLENVQSAAGASVDFAIIDEAAQIDPEAWHRAVLPPLADRNGQALLISSWEGEGAFFHEKALEAQTAQGKTDWAYFQDATWDVNFYMFPLGRQSPALLREEREMPPIDFLEQFGAIPAKKKTLVFPEFRETVHVGNYDFNPDHPVILAVDPSGGANPYAVVVLQDYKEYAVIIDEFYEKAMTAEEISPLLNKRFWRPNVTDMVVDSASPVEVERWARMGWPAYPVPDKPEIEDRLPLYRNLLRDPVRYARFYRLVLDRLLVELGMQPGEDYFLPPDQQRSLAIQAEERISDKNMSKFDREQLKNCARLFVNSACIWTIHEHHAYSYVRSRGSTLRNVREKPQDVNNHIIDALGYWTWVFHRSDDVPDMMQRSLLETHEEQEILLPRPTPNDRYTFGFLGQMRERHAGPSPTRQRSLVQTVRA